MSEGTTTPAPGTLAADPAFAQFPAEIQGAFKNKGWDGKPIMEAVLESMRSYQEAERFLGAPKDKLVRLPKDATDEAGIKEFRTRTGVPDDVKGYDFSAIKFNDGTALDPNAIGALAPALHAAGVPKERAPEIMAAFVKFMDSADTEASAAATAKLATERDALKANWGANFEANKFIASQAVQKLGWSEEVVNGLEQVAGYKNIMDALLKVGQMMGEDKFVSTQHGPKGIMTADQAQARLNELKADRAWVTKFNAGDATANREHDDLIRIIAASRPGYS
jgi:hypothetical protein